MGTFGGLVWILPYLEQENLYRRWDPNAKWYEPPNTEVVSTEIKVFYCPSNRTSGLVDMSFLVPIAGRSLPNPAACDYKLCKGANAAMCENTQIPPAGRGAFDVNTRTRLTDITDGTSQTFAAGEGAGGNQRFRYRMYYHDTSEATSRLFPGQSPFASLNWYAGPAATTALNSLGLMGDGPLGVTAIRGGHADPFDEPMNRPLSLPGFDCNFGCVNAGTQPNTYDTIGGFRSLHVNGCHFLFCDGSVRYVREGLSSATYRALSTIAGGEIVEAP
jgi:prepilin-type processing-associated H-X9-DG protein